MLFETIANGGCRSYLYGCNDTRVAVLIDPALSQIDRYLSLANQAGFRIHYIIETHTHADHFTGAKTISKKLDIPVVMHRNAPAVFAEMRLDDGDTLKVGNLRLRFMHTPGHTADSMCIVGPDRVFTGDTLLIGATGRTDLPTGDPAALYHSLFEKVLKLPPEMEVYPAHEYKARENSTISREVAENPRLQVADEAAFLDLMQTLNLSMPTHLTEALRVNMSGGASVSQLLDEAANVVPFVSMDELQKRRAAGTNNLVVLDVRERDAFDKAHIPGAAHLPRGQLELRVNEAFPDPTLCIVTYCEFGKISVLAAATLRQMGFTRASTLDGGLEQWIANEMPTEQT
jgi:glyoxylase-like metal-dependent hydrolase (beta-lactamase superfamily II)/rhodanese-related sulfurtransferase